MFGVGGGYIGYIWTYGLVDSELERGPPLGVRMRQETEKANKKMG